jgi:mycothiol system anti-sigma-R factor
MKCENVYNCLCSYLDRELDSLKAMAVELHLKSCPDCRKELELQQTVKFMIQKKFAKLTAPDSLKKRLSFELERSEDYRESGIEALDLIRWGTHIAHFYNTKKDITEIHVPFLGEGLKNNELCVWILAEISESEAKNAIAKKVPNLNEYIEKKQLQMFSYNDWYLSNGGFNVEKVLNNAVTKCQEAITNGYSGLRATGILSWIDKSDWDSFMLYENLLDNTIPKQKALITCVYKESKCNTSEVADIIDKHKYVISKKDDLWHSRKSTACELIE